MKSIILLLTCLCLMPWNTMAQDSSYDDEIEKYWNNRFAGFFSDPSFPLDSVDAHYLSYYQPDSLYNVSAKVQILSGEQPFQMPTYAGTSAEYIRYAIAEFQIGDSETIQLTLYRNTRLFENPRYKDHLFVPFLDATNGLETYGGGRYLDLSSADIHDGYLQIDFNKAYNPLCAYSGGYRCPIPPIENHLSVSILAGERSYTGPIKERPVLVP